MNNENSQDEGDISSSAPAVRAASDHDRGEARFALREQTAEQHRETEVAFDTYDISREDHYRAFLSAHAVALPGLELAVTGRGWSGFHPRLPRLADDLAALGAWLPSPMLASERCDAGVWGTQYVLEGSKLGGRVLSRRLADNMPARYLTPDHDMSARWQDFCAAFDAASRKADENWRASVISAAVETFQSFRRAATALAGDLR